MAVSRHHTVTLSQPIRIGDTTVTSVQVRKPNAGELRGIKLLDLVQMDVSQVIKLLPRITSPALPPSECQALGPIDLMAFAGEITSMFFSADEIEAEAAALRAEVEDAELVPLDGS